jgi:hypothetical protein
MVQLTTSSSGVNGMPFTIYLTGNVRRLAVFSSGGGSGGMFVDGASQASPRLGGITQTLNTPQLLCITRKNITTMTARLNGSQVSSSDFPGTTNFTSSSSYFVYISHSTGPWSGNMYEILHYNRDISDLEIQQIEGYLSWKWGLQALLPRSHPFSSASPYQTLSVPISRSVPLKMSSSTYFSPTAVAGCRLWLDGADPLSGTLLSNGATVSTWYDKSGNSNNAAATVSGATFTAASQNGNGYVTFPTGKYFTTTNFVISANNTPTIFLVCQQTGYSGSGNSEIIYGSVGTPYPFYTLDIFGNLGNKVLNVNMYSNVNANGTISIASPTLISIVGSGSPNYNVTLWGNGTSNVTFTGSSTNPTSVSMGLYIGAQSGFIGNIYEIIIFDTAFTTAQRQQTEGYLAWKWGLQSSLPPTHPNYTIPYVPFPFPTSIPKASTRVWSPLRVSGSQLWFDASDLTTITQSSGTVSEWRDKSSNAYSVIQGTASNRPTYTTNLLNGLPGIQLSATTYLYQVGSSIPNFSSSPATTVYMVAKNGSTMTNWSIINTMFFIGDGGGTNRYHLSFGYGTANGLTLLANGSYIVSPSSYVVPLNSNAIIGFSSSATSNFLFYNGSNTSYYSSGALPTANNSTWFLFGDARTSINAVSDENIYEFVGFNTILTREQQQSVEGYLAWKWGLRTSLPAGHPYINFPPSP